MSGVLSFCLTLDTSGLLKGAEHAQGVMNGLVAYSRMMSRGMLDEFSKVQAALGGMEGKFAGVGLSMGEMFGAQLNALAEQVLQMQPSLNFTAMYDPAKAQVSCFQGTLGAKQKGGAASPEGKAEPKTLAVGDSSGRPCTASFAFPNVDFARIFDAMNAQANGRLEAMVRQYCGKECQNIFELGHESNPIAPEMRAPATRHLPNHLGASGNPSFAASGLDVVKLVVNGGGVKSENTHNLAKSMADNNKSLGTLTALVAQQTAILKQIADAVRHNHLNLE